MISGKATEPDIVDRWFASRRPVLVLLAFVIFQQALTFWARDLWWADEVRQAAVLRHMVESGDWFGLRLNGIAYPDKPPLYFWLMAILAKVLGSVDPPVVFFGLAVTFALYVLSGYWLARLFGNLQATALTAGLILLTTPYVALLAHYARMDFLFSAFIVAAWGFLYRGARENRFNWFMIAGFAAMGLAAITKGPFGVLFPVLTLVLYLLWVGQGRRLLKMDVALGLVSTCAIVGVWIAGVVLAHEPGFLAETVRGQIIDRGFRRAGGFLSWFRYAATFPLTFMPWTIVFALTMKWRLSLSAARDLWLARKAQTGHRTFLWIAVVSSLAVLTASSEKMEYYLLPLFVPLAVLLAERLKAVSHAFSRGMAYAWAGFLVLLAALVAAAGTFIPASWQVEISSLAWAALLLAAGAILALRQRAIRIQIVFLALAMSFWINIAVLRVMPALDKVYSPAPIAVEMLREGGSLASFGLVPGVLAYHLKSQYAEPRSHAALRGWLAASGRASVAMPQRVLLRDFPELANLRLSRSFNLAGETIVVVHAP